MFLIESNGGPCMSKNCAKGVACMLMWRVGIKNVVGFCFFYDFLFPLKQIADTNWKSFKHSYVVQTLIWLSSEGKIFHGLIVQLQMILQKSHKVHVMFFFWVNFCHIGTCPVLFQYIEKEWAEYFSKSLLVFRGRKKVRFWMTCGWVNHNRMLLFFLHYHHHLSFPSKPLTKTDVYYFRYYLIKYNWKYNSERKR